jgi:Domain of unknown function (DUF4160)
MAKVHTIGKTEIRIYANDHIPAHFHIVHPDFEALIEIETFATYAGSLGKGSAGKTAMEWARANIPALKAEWNRINPRFPVT